MTSLFLASASTPVSQVHASRTIKHGAVVLVLMILAAVAAHFLTPTTELADTLPEVHLDKAIPTEFGDWKAIQDGEAGVVNPQATTLVNQLYSQVVNRIFFNAKTGAYMMLSIAYGRSQRDNVSLHVPDYCYPAQGFQLSQTSGIDLKDISGRNIPAKRAVGTLGSRVEPMIYWTTVGGQVARTGFERKMAQLGHGLHGRIPDGFVFRVSTLNQDVEAAWKAEHEFIRELGMNIEPQDFERIAGSHS